MVRQQRPPRLRPWIAITSERKGAAAGGLSARLRDLT
jgi:hypothetical protein